MEFLKDFQRPMFNVFKEIHVCNYAIILRYNIIYYIASSDSGQDESNPALWLATQAGKICYLARLGLPAVSRKKNSPRAI